MKKVAIQTLGCRANQLESSIIADKFTEYGWQVVNFREKADIYIINTCTVTEKSDSTSRYFIRKAKKTNPDAKIIVAGCYPQVAPDEIAKIKEVDLVLGNTEKLGAADLIVKEGLLNKEVLLSPLNKEKHTQKGLKIISPVKNTIEITPPELISDVMKKGICLAGGGALLGGLDTLITKETKIPAYVIEDPMTAVARGAGAVLENINEYAEVLVETDELVPPK